MIDTGARVKIGLDPERNAQVALFIFEDRRVEIGQLNANLWANYPEVREAFIETVRRAAMSSITGCLQPGEHVRLVEDPPMRVDQGNQTPRPRPAA